MREPQIRYAKTSDGVNIAYYAIGEGTPFVWPSSPLTSIGQHWRAQEMRELLELIAGRALLVSHDARGFGLSDRGEMDFSCDAMVRDLEAVVDAAAPGPIILQAFGYMTIPSLAYAQRHPNRVQALILIDGITSAKDMSPDWHHVVRAAGEDWEYATKLLIQSNDAGFALTATLEQARESLLNATTQDAFLAFCEALEGWDASDVAGRVETPAIVTHYSNFVSHYPLEGSRRLAAALPNGRFAPVHAAAGQTVTEAALPVVMSFLREVVPPQEPRRSGQAALDLPTGTAVILFADIVDSTALTERLGDDAFREKARELDTALRALIRDHSGTPIEGKLLGDGVLATFASARQAIEAALACGRAGDDGGLPLHLGLHAGDVIREEGNVFGGAVNVAARISGLSAPGEVLVSDIVRGLARTSAGVSFEDRGEQELKGVGEPVRVWAVVEAE
jgi:class 3 adenylate cyclase